MPLGPYTVDELAERCARNEIEIERLRSALTTIRDTFAKDIAQGYRTNDKEFAIDIANGGLLGRE